LIEQKLFNWPTAILEALPEVVERIHIGHRATTLEIALRTSSIRTLANIFGGGMRESAMKGSRPEVRQTIVMRVLAESPRSFAGQGSLHHAEWLFYSGLHTGEAEPQVC
jgi:hypothetical protein